MELGNLQIFFHPCCLSGGASPLTRLMKLGLVFRLQHPRLVMSRFSSAPYSSAKSTISVYLHPSHPRQSTIPHKDIDEQICPACKSSSRDQSIHWISVPQTPLCSPTTDVPFSCRQSALPALNVDIPQGWSKLQSTVAALHLDSEGRPQMRFRRNAFSPISHPAPRDSQTKRFSNGSVGLGTTDAPSKSDTNPLTPETAEKSSKDIPATLGYASDLAQRIEQRLRKYSASRNIITR